jgi:drug/metabolite transporter (DMT)-like permease
MLFIISRMMIDLFILILLSAIISIIAYKTGRKRKKMETWPAVALTVGSVTFSTVTYYAVHYIYSNMNGRQAAPLGVLDFE